MAVVLLYCFVFVKLILNHYRYHHHHHWTTSPTILSVYRSCTRVILMSSYARTASGRFLGALYSDEETDREQRASVPVILDDADVHAIIDDVESRPHTAENEGASAISSKPSTIADKSSRNAPRNTDTGDVASVRSQPIPSHDDPAPSPQTSAAKTPPRRAQSLSATSHTANHRQETSLNTSIPSVSVVSSTPVSPTAPESFGRVQEDRIAPPGRSTPVNDRDHRQSRRRSVMDVRVVPFFWNPTLGLQPSDSRSLSLRPLLLNLLLNIATGSHIRDALLLGMR